eukprot:evm.model.scf_2179.4 EVM.evm.TU.scf_2179.4   scf_2179:20296-22503(-)
MADAQQAQSPACDATGTSSGTPLAALQSQLRDLRRRYGAGLKLKKSLADSASGCKRRGCVLAVRIPNPDAGSSFDVDCLDVRVRLGPAFLPEGVSGQDGVESELGVEVVNQGFPDELRVAIAGRLAEAGRGGALGALFDAAERDFDRLLGCVPEAVEAYESVDAMGATVRRFAIREASLEGSSSAPVVAGETLKHAPPAEMICRGADGPQDSARGLDPDGGAGVSCERHENEQKDEGQDVEMAGPIARELGLVAKRYPEGFRWRADEQASRPVTGAEYSLSLTPSDPDWDRGDLEFSGRLWMGDVGEMGVSASLAGGGGVVPEAWDQINSSLACECGLAAGRPNALRWIAKFLEGHSARVVVEAEAAVGGGPLEDALTAKTDNEDNQDSGDEVQGDSESVEEGGCEASALQSTAGSTAVGCLSLQLEDLKLDNIDVMEGLQLAIETSPKKVRRGGPVTDSKGKGEFGRGRLVVGEPLPELGTCKHYRHSHRWLRFPCCGRRFPCDLCHEELTDGHAMKWATRMVCGYCSVEQSLGEACRRCGKKLAGSAALPSGRGTQFWEGGTGCRDHRRLSKKDPRKWGNSKLKTKSNKQNRVGQKAARRQERS